jgi:hypothetical protein
MEAYMKATLTGSYLVAEGLDDFAFGEASFEEFDSWVEYWDWEFSYMEFDWDLTDAEMREVFFGIYV